ncbi:DUF1266 domain-containing protein [Glaciihabitans sp. dw_435]|uniref:DUF1266 domain-containing protein n=1 Tax=Glaciihabitans sp. dw_435 TaxID=2720081 RepID=UPI001BD1FA73|nr:DUF1266 domain-containing protein [Glaciihabitans sp. dw_435]
MGLFGKKKSDEPAAAGGDPNQQLLSYGAILVTANKRKPETLGMETSGKFDAAALLRSAWEVSSTEEARATIEWLLTEGDRDEHDDAFRAYQNGDPTMLPAASRKMLDTIYKGVNGATIRGGKITRDQLGSSTSILAWDLERAAFVARLAFNAGYLSEAEAWEVLARVQAVARANYSEWLAYLISFISGRSIVMANSDADEMHYIFLDGRNLDYMKKEIWYLNPLR